MEQFIQTYYPIFTFTDEFKQLLRLAKEEDWEHLISSSLVYNDSGAVTEYHFFLALLLDDYLYQRYQELLPITSNFWWHPLVARHSIEVSGLEEMLTPDQVDLLERYLTINAYRFASHQLPVQHRYIAPLARLGELLTFICEQIRIHVPKEGIRTLQLILLLQ